ncbi:uncharacterized protein LOC103714514 [Phoenix dactylifera]|uniref:Uncharacterized protein LOC103714514 n=1 Tax=Phoenix dactylifera TaxID=42345 RepID=A0A8B9A776_PHODC|nr:uncharacterized protein LOC103714514 [Phoenix dactylifera]
MRFKKGCKVEVLRKREVPSGSWWGAEIISGDGHTYSVKYDHYSPDMDGVVERVPRKAIRPCPPPVKCPRSWVPGDIVEVYENNSWKLGEVSRVVGGNCFFVRLLGSSRQFRVHISDLRVRLSWQNSKWVVIQKKAERSNDALVKSQTKTRNFSQLMQSCIELEKYGGHDHVCTGNNNRAKEPTSRCMKKRPHFCLSPVDSCTGSRRKMRAVEKERCCRQVTTAHSSQLLEKVDAVASPCKLLGEKYMHAFLNHKVCEMGMHNQKPPAGAGYRFIESIEPNDAESVSSSVGSCSPSNSPYRSILYPIYSPIHDLGSNCNDAESPCASGRELPLHTKEALEAEIHRLELHAYRCTLLALYASGPLSWEQEVLITNLRFMLRISNDEHLSELRAKVGGLYSLPQGQDDGVWHRARMTK